MKAIQVKKFGPPNVLKIETVDVPKVNPTNVSSLRIVQAVKTVYSLLLLTHFLAFQILIKIESAGVNPVDTYIREGAFLNVPDLPFIPRKDGAGVIHEIGEDVKTFQVLSYII